MKKLLTLLMLTTAFGFAQDADITWYGQLGFGRGTSTPGYCNAPSMFYNTGNSLTYICLGHSYSSIGSAGGGITQLTGDVTAGPGSGSQAVTVTKVNGQTLGTSSLKNTGTSGNTVPLLDGVNTWSNSQTIGTTLPTNAPTGTSGASVIYSPSEALNVRAYGASGSATATTTVGSTTGGATAVVTASATTFAKGQGIYIVGAGTAGACHNNAAAVIDCNYVGTVVSIASNTITITPATTTTVANGTVVAHEDYAAIAAALAAGTTVYLPAGTYNICSQVAPPAGARIFGDSRSASIIFRLANCDFGSAAPAIHVATSNVVLQSFTIDDNGPNQYQLGEGTKAINVDTGAQYVWINDVWAKNAGGQVIKINNASDVSVTNSLATGSSSGGTSGASTTPSVGIGVGAAGNTTSRVLIGSNTVTGNGGTGIQVANGTNIDIRIIGNQSYNNSPNSTLRNAEINLSQVIKNLMVVDNTITTDATLASGQYGIATNTGTGSFNWLISGNTVNIGNHVHYGFVGQDATGNGGASINVIDNVFSCPSQTCNGFTFGNNVPMFFAQNNFTGITGTANINAGIGATNPQLIISSNPGYNTNTNPILSGVTGSISGGLTLGTCDTGTATVTGATTSMTATASPTTFPGTGVLWNAYVSAADIVTVVECGLAVITPTATTYQVRVIP